jgi:hypothetical protein
MQNEVFVGACHQVSQGPFPCHTIAVSSVPQAPGQLVRGYYVCITLIVSKSVDKQEGISVRGFDPRFFVRLASKAGSANCSKKSPLNPSCQARSFSSESRAGLGG